MYCLKNTLEPNNKCMDVKPGLDILTLRPLWAQIQLNKKTGLKTKVTMNMKLGIESQNRVEFETKIK